MMRTDLFFGLARKDAPPVSPEEWQDFVDTTVTPLFQEGLTIFDADGQYQSPSGPLVKEDSKVLILLHDGTRPHLDAIESIRGAYIQRFDQDSVLRVDTPVCVAF